MRKWRKRLHTHTINEDNDLYKEGNNMKKAKTIILSIVLALMISACTLPQIKAPDTWETEKPNIGNRDDEQNNGDIKDIATKVINVIKDKDMERLSEFVHPEDGVRFSPYGYVDVENDLVFAASDVRKLLSDSTLYAWGSYDGTGDPIELTFEDYYKKFIYDVDFANAEQIGYNEILGHGNTLENSAEVYKDSTIVEYHFPGFDPQYEGLDWRSLRIVFEKVNDTWYLVGIIHDEWTI